VENFNALKTEFHSFSENWLKLGNILKLAVARNSYNPEDEQNFLALKNIVARQQRLLAQRVPEGKTYDFGSAEIGNMLKSQLVALNQIVQYTDPDKKRAIQDWHKVYMRILCVSGAFHYLHLCSEKKPGFFERIFKKNKKG